MTLVEGLKVIWYDVTLEIPVMRRISTLWCDVTVLLRPREVSLKITVMRRISAEILLRSEGGMT